MTIPGVGPSEAPPDDSGGNRYVRPTPTAAHSGSTISCGRDYVCARSGHPSAADLEAYRLQGCSVPIADLALAVRFVQRRSRQDLPEVSHLPFGHRSCEDIKTLSGPRRFPDFAETILLFCGGDAEGMFAAVGRV
jgi:hypothetical protein